MESRLLIKYSHRLEGHFPSDDIDTDFYKTLTGLEETYVDPETGLPEPPIPSMEQDLMVVGTTLLPSANVAAMIKAWLDKNRTRITISDPQGHRKIEFRGPNLDKRLESVKEMIETLVAEANTNELTIQALRIEPAPLMDAETCDGIVTGI